MALLWVTASNDQWDEKHDHLFSYREHDYDPREDYDVQVHQMSHPLIRHAQARADHLASLPSTPFEKAHVYPARLHHGTVATYCAGTYTEPVILLDLDKHQDSDVISPKDEVRRSVDHEVTHAMQESEWSGEGSWANEDHAEGHRFSDGGGH